MVTTYRTKDYNIATEHCKLQPKVEIFLQSLICIFWANKELCVIIMFVFYYFLFQSRMHVTKCTCMTNLCVVFIENLGQISFGK